MAKAWNFLKYWDDVFNFLNFPTLNSLSPLSLDHFLEIINHRGINVFEPISGLLKAAMIDLVGLNPVSLRLSTGFFHCINSCLLVVWLRLLSISVNKNSKKNRTHDFSVYLVGIIFLIHPLHAEIVGWLSAQNYAFSLFFALLSSISMECFVVVRDRKSMKSLLVWSVLSIIFYILACLCKAPAMVLPVIFIARLLLTDFMGGTFCQTASQNNLRYRQHCAVVFIFFVLISGGLVVHLVFRANYGSEAGSVGSFASFRARIARAAVVISGFISRAIAPIDLRAHYKVPEEECFSLDSMLRDVSDLLRHIFLFPVELASFLGLYPDLITSIPPTSSSPSYSLCSVPNFGATILTSLTLLLVISVVVLVSALCDDRPLLLLGWLSYLLCWAPGCGLVTHGWEQLGADRYNYFPLAFVSPLLLELLQSFMNLGGSDEVPTTNESDDTDGIKADVSESVLYPIRPFRYLNNWKRSLRLTALLLIAVVYVVTMGLMFCTQLMTWRSDKDLLVHCVSVDPTDWECHQYLGDYYGYHEADEEKGRAHNLLSLQHLPRSVSMKNLLFKSRMLLFLQGREEACSVVYQAVTEVVKGVAGSDIDIMSSDIAGTGGSLLLISAQEIDDGLLSVSDIDSVKKNQNGNYSKRGRLGDLPFYSNVINNFVLCEIAERGVTVERLAVAELLMYRAVSIARKLNRPSSMIEELEQHVHQIQAAKSNLPGHQYIAPFQCMGEHTIITNARGARIQREKESDKIFATVARVLFKHFTTFGVFDEIASDPGTAFMADIVTQLVQWRGMQHKISLVGRHQSNGVEGTSKQFLRYLTTLVADERLVDNWSDDSVLALINYELASFPSCETGGYTPFELKYGRSDAAYFRLPDPGLLSINAHEFILQLEENIKTVNTLSLEFQQKLAKECRVHAGVASQDEFGDFVLWDPLENPTDHLDTELTPHFSGPYQILRQAKNDVVCKHVNLGTEHTFHVTRLRPFFGSFDVTIQW